MARSPPGNQAAARVRVSLASERERSHRCGGTHLTRLSADYSGQTKGIGSRQRPEWTSPDDRSPLKIGRLAVRPLSNAMMPLTRTDAVGLVFGVIKTGADGLVILVV